MLSTPNRGKWAITDDYNTTRKLDCGQSKCQMPTCQITIADPLNLTLFAH